MSDSFELKWGIVGLGAFAAKWANDVFSNYELDAIHGKLVNHQLKAVVSTTSIQKAESFIKLLNTEATGIPQTYDSWEIFLAESDIDIVYIAAPNALHYPLALQALQAGKHVLVEKTFTINHEQAQHLKEVGAKNKLFILDGIWTRFLPTTKAIQKLILQDKVIGEVHRVSADLSHNCPFDESGRLYNPELGPGVLYDNLIYSIAWTDLLLLSQAKTDPIVKTFSLKSKDVPEIDTATSISLVFNDLNAIGTASGSFSLESPRDSVLIEGTKGYIKLDRASKPSTATLYSNGSPEGTNLEIGTIGGLGYYYEANVAAISIRDSLLEPVDHPLDESIRVLKIFDQVKKANGIVFPPSIEKISKTV
ncbi:unnamed protein product [Kuraishia capsulata CBS 1993]|uniref:D-xylose 1-dehydrogenase (NADP(+), D-xylono-1,5-lactone-forming) n=1 Tax=Kuraishia capsulata CBS 1993 TaxID=1382522 RepID=W6MMK2_9ASCO|nr:uncharacterized protein KUCA_T00003765001 [Kuraishia capsulata CBS 1993]CDK27786.1 unnamed protein product [Kuraishia capsulata CBS 1993]